MIGMIGTAPKNEDISCGIPDIHSGNMYCKMITEGTTLLLPVHVNGGLLALGDLHVAMGDGEVSVYGLEVEGIVEVTVDLIKGTPYPLPLLRTENYLYTIASAKTLDQAGKMATEQMVDFLVTQGKMTKSDAISLLSIAGDLQICQVVDPNKTCRMAIPLKIVE